jgi:cyclopropane fatty-acyl-phospholipid synthase-like methyltransferase
MIVLSDSPASERNKRPILEVLREEFRDARNILEIGSGTGQHAVYLASELSHLTWQTSDLAENHDVIRARLALGAYPRIKPPLLLDVETFELPDDRIADVDGVFSANTAHIMGIRGVQRMFALVGEILPAGASFCLYGPFNFNGEFSSDSNARFDASLRQRKSVMGIRDIADLDRFAGDAGMERVRLYAMPAMNYIAVWQKAIAQQQHP